jgi:hypothetical protein
MEQLSSFFIVPLLEIYEIFFHYKLFTQFVSLFGHFAKENKEEEQASNEFFTQL